MTWKDSSAGLLSEGVHVEAAFDDPDAPPALCCLSVVLTPESDPLATGRRAPRASHAAVSLAFCSPFSSSSSLAELVWTRGACGAGHSRVSRS